MPNQGFLGKELSFPAAELLPRFTRQGAVTAKAARALGAIGFIMGNDAPCGLRVARETLNQRIPAPRGPIMVGALAAMGVEGIYFFFKNEVDKLLMLVSEMSFYEMECF